MKIVLIDDHEIFRLGLRALLDSQADVEIVGEAGSGSEGFKVIADTEPDVVLLDFAMPDISGIEILSTLRHRYPELYVILLTASKAEFVLSEALAAGAHAVVLKQDASGELVQALGEVQSGEQFLSKSISPLVQRAQALSILTKREKQVLRLIAHGRRNREIAEELNVSMKTVDTHRTNLMRKLDLHNLVDVVDFANQVAILDTTI